MDESGGGGTTGGLRAAVPVVTGYLPAAAFGVAARGAGLSTPETVLMSLVVYSGAGQFALAGLISTGASLLAMIATALLLALRHVLYGPALAPYLRRLGGPRAALVAFGLTDEVFAVASVRLTWRPSKFRWIVALEAAVSLSWALGTWAGASAGAVVTEAMPSLAPALSFALPALFVALLVPMTSGSDAASAGAVVVAGIVAACLHLAGLATWGVLAAGVAGPAFGVLLRRRRTDEG